MTATHETLIGKGGVIVRSFKTVFRLSTMGRLMRPLACRYRHAAIVSVAAVVALAGWAEFAFAQGVRGSAPRPPSSSVPSAPPFEPPVARPSQPVASPMSVGPFEEATVAYSNGDYATALRLFESLANQGNIDAQYDLGVMYANGRGVPQDYVQAHMWFNLASTGGDPAAIEGRDSIAKLMSPAEIAEAQKLAHEWKGHPSSGRPSTKSSNH